jgi:hypothetical protein
MYNRTFNASGSLLRAMVTHLVKGLPCTTRENPIGRGLAIARGRVPALFLISSNEETNPAL